MSTKPEKDQGVRQDFADGSAVVTYPDGSALILEGKLAKVTVINERRTRSYSDPPPPPPPDRQR